MNKITTAIKKNRATTLIGVSALIAAIGLAINQIFDGNPDTNPDWNVLIPLLITAVTGIFARNAWTTSEESK